MSNHNLEIRVITEDGILVSSDTDFAEDAQYDHFAEVLRNAEENEVVQLIDNSDDRVIAEEIKR